MADSDVYLPSASSNESFDTSYSSGKEEIEVSCEFYHCLFSKRFFFFVKDTQETFESLTFQETLLLLGRFHTWTSVFDKVHCSGCFTEIWWALAPKKNRSMNLKEALYFCHQCRVQYVLSRQQVSSARTKAVRSTPGNQTTYSYIFNWSLFRTN